MSTLITRDYQGNTFVFREDGYFNMTKAAKVFGKETKEFLRLPSTIEYIEALAKVGNSHAYEAKRGHNGGTWGHPKLAVLFVRWLNAKFAVFCDMVIDDILNKKAELTITKPAESAVMNLPKSFAEALRLAAELEEQKEKLALEKQRLLPKAEGYDTFMNTESYFSTTNAAKALGIGTAQALNEWMKKNGWKFKDSDTPTALAVRAGYLAVKIRCPEGSVRA